MVEIGKPAPDAPFLLVNSHAGLSIPSTISAFKGKPLLLYFYPKDDTTGCTKEAIDFTAHAETFAQAGTVVLGMSKDSIKSHQKFISKHNLTVQLGSDENGAVCEAFGVWVEKSMYGRNYMGIERATYLIDAHGIVKQIWRKVKVAGHVENVLVALKSIT